MESNKEGIYLLLSDKGNDLMQYHDNKLSKFSTDLDPVNLNLVAMHGYQSLVPVAPDENLVDALYKEFTSHYTLKYGEKKTVQILRLNVNPGEYCPRIAKNVWLSEGYQTPFETGLPYDDDACRLSVNQLATIKEMLISILNNVYPKGNNLHSYGHNIRNLLVLSCIEVETELHGIYKANANSMKRQYTTKDYVKLNQPLKLDEYQIKLSYYPESLPISPFANWNENASSKSLQWYNSYNGAKHNSKEEFENASLKNLLSAVCAIAVLIIAQYGNDNPQWQEQLGSFFRVSKWPELTKYEDFYFPPFAGNRWIEKKLFE